MDGESAGRRGRERKVNGAQMLQTIISSESYIFLAVFAVLALVALVYLLSPQMSTLVEDITARGAEIRTRLRELLPDDYPAADTETILLRAYVDIALNITKPSGSLLSAS